MIQLLSPSDIVIHGGARGADTLAGELATQAGLAVESYPADWKTHGKAAGPIRNQKMLATNPDLVIGFPLEGSVGTMHMLLIARKRGIPVIVPDPDLASRPSGPASSNGDLPGSALERLARLIADLRSKIGEVKGDDGNER